MKTANVHKAKRAGEKLLDSSAAGPSVDFPAAGPAAAQDTKIVQSGLGGGAYEGAARMSRELASWRATNRSADADMLPNKSILDARSTDISRNDAYIENGITKRKDSVVGAKFQLNASPNITYLEKKDKRLDETWAEEFQEEVEALWELSAESNSRWIDAQRKKTATEIIRLSLGSVLIHGEVIISSEWIRRSRRPFKTAYQMIDPARMDDPHVSGYGNENNKNIRRGVRLNQYGEPVGYFISSDHPHDYYPSIRSITNGKMFQYTPTETPWGRTNILHAFEEQRVGQSRGLSKMVSALSEMKMTKKFREVMLQNAIVNATYAAAIESELPTKEVFEMMGGADVNSEEFESAISNYSAGYLSSLQAYLEGTNGTMLNGVKIPHLFPGTKLNLMPAASGGPLGTEFEQSLLRYLAANFNMSYEQFSGDMQNVNYSTLKGAINETEKHVKVEKRIIADRVANFMYCNWLEEMFVTNQISCMPRNSPVFWDDMNREAYSAAEWTNSGRGQIEELKETQAATLRLKANLTTLEDEQARFGKDWRRSIRQKARERDYAKKFKIDLSFEDNGLNAASGSPRDKTPSDEPEVDTRNKKKDDD